MIFTITRPKALKLLDELVHTTRTDDLNNLFYALSEQDGDIRINKFTAEGMSLYGAYHFFDQVGMLDD